MAGIQILWTVHEMTGFLDCFKLVNASYHDNILPEEEQTRLALTTVLARGMNIGLKGIVKSLQGTYGIGRLTNFDDNYVSNSIVFYNKAAFGERIEKELGNVNMHPAFWQHINSYGIK